MVDARLEESKRRAAQPQYRLGYFYQSLEKNHGYQGVQVTLGIPLDKRTEKTRMQKLTLEQHLIDSEREMQARQITERIHALESTLAQLQTSISFYDEELLGSQSRMLEVIRQQLELGEIDFFDFYQTQRLIVEKRNEYLDLIRMYNEKWIDLQFLSILK